MPETGSLEPLKKLKKNLDLIEDHCVENNIIDEAEEKPIAETAEIVRLKLDFEQLAQRACEAEKALQDAQFAEAQKAVELRLAE